MIRYVAAMLMAIASGPAIAQSVETADGNWSTVPPIADAQVHLGQQSMARIDALIDKGKCAQFGTTERVRLDVPFLLKFRPNGQVSRIVIKRLNCPELEAVIGGIVRARAQAGLYKPSGVNRTGWYRSDFSYHTY